MGLSSWTLVGYQKIRRVVEIARVRNDDAVALGETVQGFDFRNRSRSKLYGSAHGVVAVHHVEFVSAFVNHRAAFKLQDVVALVKDDTHGSTLVLAQSRR